MSTSLNLEQFGRHKLLQAKNGNTLHFYMVPNRAIAVSVFDTAGVKISSFPYEGKDLNVRLLNETYFKGLFNVGDEAVLFLEQEWYAQNTLFRMRFNTVNGKLIEEARLVSARNTAVLGGGKDDNYAVVTVRTPGNPERRDGMMATLYNRQHVNFNEHGLGWNTERTLDAFEPASAGLVDVHLDKDAGIFFTAHCKGGTRMQMASGTASNRHIINCRMGWNDSCVRYTVVDMQENLFPDYSLTCWDSKSNTDRQMLVTQIPITEKRNGITYVMFPQLANYYVWRHEDLGALGRKLFMPADTSHIKTSGAHESLTGVPLYLHACEDGNSILFSEDYDYGVQNGVNYNHHSTRLANISVQMLRPNGREVWKLEIPKLQKANGQVTGREIHTRNWNRVLGYSRADFATSYDNMLSFDLLSGWDNAWYLVYNKPYVKDTSATNWNADVRFAEPMLTKITASGTSSTTPLFTSSDYPAGELGLIIDSGNFNVSTGQYAVVAVCGKGEKAQVRIVWCRLPESENVAGN